MEESKKFLKELFEKISPVLISPTSSSITLSLSKRFMLFTLLKKTAQKIEDEPHLNFISLLKYYKVLGKFLQGTIYEFHRDRNKAYFRDFFVDREIYKKIKEDLEYVFEINKNLNLTISKEGFIVYDNYKKNQFNILLITAHSGTYLPHNIEEKIYLTKEQRKKEEDIDTDRIYCKLVLEQGGIWVDNKYSRYYCDLNRNLSRCIYQEEVPNAVVFKKLWKEKLTNNEIKEIHEFHKEFYSLISRILETYKFNIVFDGHSMKNLKGRPNISFGTHYIPKFYLPIVRSMRSKLNSIGYVDVTINKPYGGGFILKWLSTMYPDLFIFSMEINKSMYMTKNMMKVKINKREKLSKDLVNIIDITEEEGFRLEKKPY